jgi:hypothetical protein
MWVNLQMLQAGSLSDLADHQPTVQRDNGLRRSLIKSVSHSPGGSIFSRSANQAEPRPMCWIVSGLEKLHSFGLLNGSFRPEAQIRKLRTYMRLRG